MKDFYDVVVVGAGSAGFNAADAARATDSSITILLLNGESRLPYRRTRISKRIKDGFDWDELTLRPASWFEDRGIDLLNNAVAAAINPVEKSVTLSGGEATVRYGSLVLAVGSEPLFPKVVRPHERESFAVVRNAADGDDLRARASRAKSVLVAGMGILAVEVANQLTMMGKQVTLAGATPQLMPRQLTARGGEILEEALSARKVKLLFQEEILSFEHDNKKAWAVQMLKHSGHYDLVVFCIGVSPRAGLAAAAGLEVRRGVRVDESLRTSRPDIFAAGDCAEFPDGHISHLWREAADQGRIAGMNAAGGSNALEIEPYRLESEVFGQHIFSIGKPRDPWQYVIEEYEEGPRYLALYWRDDRLAGAVAFNRADDADAIEAAVRGHADRSELETALESA